MMSDAQSSGKKLTAMFKKSKQKKKSSKQDTEDQGEDQGEHAHACYVSQVVSLLC